jgi:hypothetical protein
VGKAKRLWRIGSLLAAIGSVACAETAYGQSASIATPPQEDKIFTSDVPAKQSAVAARPHADFAPIGLELGNVTIDAAVENDTEYNDNIFLDQSHTADVIDHLKPRLDLAEDFFDTAVSISASADVARYMIFHSENYENYSVVGTTHRDIAAESSIGVTGGTRRISVARGALNDPGRAYGPLQYQDSFFTILPQYSASPLVGTAQITGHYYQYQNDGPIDNSAQNNYSLHIGNRFGYETDGGWTYFFQPSYEVDAYQLRVDSNGVNHDVQIYQGLWGIQYDATADLYIELGAGYFWNQYFSHTQQDVGGVAELGSLIWNIDPLFTLTGSLSQSSSTLQGQLSTGVPQGLAVTTTSTLRLDYEAAYNVIGFISTGMSSVNISGQGSTEIDDTYPFSLGADWYISQYFRAGAQYLFTTTNSTNIARRVDNNRILLTLVAQM